MTQYAYGDADHSFLIDTDAPPMKPIAIPVDPSNADYAALIASNVAIADFTPPAASIPSSISDRQFFQQLAIDGIISEADALASNAAVIPPALLAIIEAMPAEQQFGAKMLVSGATVFERNHPMTLAIAAARGMTSEQVDAFFTAAAAL